MTHLRNFLKARRVLSIDLPLRFLTDSNIHAIRCTLSDCDPAYAQNDELTITKQRGGFLITHEIGRWEPFYGTETEVMPRVFTHDTKHVRAIIADRLDSDIDLINQHGKNANIKIVRFASK